MSLLLSSSSTDSDAATSSKIVALKSEDNLLFDVIEPVAMESKTIKYLLEDTSSSSDDKIVIPLPNVAGKTLSKTIQYLEGRHALSGENSEMLKRYDEDFVKEVSGDQVMIFDLILAANYLEIQFLLDLLCKAVADLMNGKTVDKIRKMFNIVNDYTPEEEAEVRKENEWAFQ
ncbi:SKP1-like protein 4 [Ricinus communis]|uniref:SKP1-like protein n=1 Tax=Ricinus communis TaxID=3988 RepID=B9RQQ0_RICCO|nr:SKP1-like protein 4 [Ricinus communis]EEF46489.1 skp1, putative [Ricinus communis]|eukprot:XP_002516069.1 SKP1-like protein 4 [Ricinus communis]